MAPHSSTLAWRIPRMEEPGGLQSTGSLRVGHNRETSLSLFPFKHRRRKCQSTPGFLPGESQGQRSRVGCRLWGHTESDRTKVTQQQHYTLTCNIMHLSLDRSRKQKKSKHRNRLEYLFVFCFLYDKVALGWVLVPPISFPKRLVLTQQSTHKGNINLW